MLPDGFATFFEAVGEESAKTGAAGSLIPESELHA
jgi:hypothetical protein